jgi:hypothetical protein
MRNHTLLLSAAAGLLAVGASLTAHADYRSTVLADNPSGYWRLNAWPGVKYAANLGSATAADGVIANFTQLGVPGGIVGDANTAMYFGGLGGNTRVTVPYNWELNLNYPGFTFETWMRTDCAKGNALGVVVNRSGESGYVVYVQSDGSFAFNINMGTGGTVWSGISIPTADFAPLVGQWVHVACVYNSTNGSPFGTQYLYTNGVLAGQVDLPRPPLANPGGALVLGDRDFAGALDEVAVYDQPLSASEIAAHYAAGMSGTGGYQATILAHAPKGYWRLGETGLFPIQPTAAANLGTLGAQAIGLHTIGTLMQQPGALVGSASKSVDFQGTKLMYAPPARCSPAAPYTVEAWVRPNITYTGTAASAVPLGSIDLDYNRSGWLFYQRGNGWSWWLGDGTGYKISLDPVSTVTAGTWYHLVGTYDGTTARFYVNGAEVASGASALPVPNPSQPFTVGGRYDGSFLFNGRVDEVAVYTSALSAADILAHYNNGISATPSPAYDTLILAHSPLTYWRMDDTAVSVPMATNLGYIGTAGDGNFNGSTPTVSTDTPLVGDSDNSLSFPASSRIDIPLHEALVRTNAFSYEIWYKENIGAGGIRSPMWWRDEPAGGDTRGWVHYLQDLTGGRGNNFQSSHTTTTWDGLNSIDQFAQGEWQHMVCTYDAALKQKQVFVNGVLINTSTNDPTNVKLVQRPAASISSGSYPFNGLLDEAAYYTNALSWQRIHAHYVAARGVNPPAVAATFKLQPAGLNAFEGSTVTVKSVVLGTPPFTYQWYKEGSTPVAGQTGANLVLSPAMQADSGNYSLKVTNPGGETWSDAAYVQIMTAPPTIVTGPQPATRLQGAGVTFTVTVDGSQPLSYQWRSNTVAIPGATTASLTINDLQTTYSANYSVYVQNSAGNATSDPAPLTVIATTPGSIAATIVADLPVAYWRLDETEASNQVAYDVVGGHNGTYDYGVTYGVPGGILGDPNPAVTFPNYAGIQVPFSPALNPFIAFSIECWVKADPNGAGMTRTIVSSRNREQSSNWHYGYYLYANADNQWQFNTGHKTTGVRGLAGGAVDGDWHHIVATYDDTLLIKSLYVDGQLVAMENPPLNTYAPNVGWGADNMDPPPTDTGIARTVIEDRYLAQGAYFWGDLDEIVIYNYALTPTQVASHYAIAGPPLLGITQAGGSVTVQWNKGDLWAAPDLTSGDWTKVDDATSPYTVPATGSMKFFQARMP